MFVFLRKSESPLNLWSSLRNMVHVDVPVCFCFWPTVLALSAVRVSRLFIQASDLESSSVNTA